METEIFNFIKEMFANKLHELVEMYILRRKHGNDTAEQQADDIIHEEMEAELDFEDEKFMMSSPLEENAAIYGALVRCAKTMETNQGGCTTETSFKKIKKNENNIDDLLLTEKDLHVLKMIFRLSIFIISITVIILLLFTPLIAGGCVFLADLREGGSLAEDSRVAALLPWLTVWPYSA